MLGRRLEKTPYVTAAGKMLANGSNDDHANPRIGIKRFKGDAQLLARQHADHIQRRAIKDDVGALPGCIDLDTETVKFNRKALCRMVQIGQFHSALSFGFKGQ